MWNVQNGFVLGRFNRCQDTSYLYCRRSHSIRLLCATHLARNTLGTNVCHLGPMRHGWLLGAHGAILPSFAFFFWSFLCVLLFWHLTLKFLSCSIF